MSVTCQVTQQTAGRIRLAVPGDTLSPETSQFLAQYLLALPGVTGIEIRPASGGVVILHNGGRMQGSKIVRMLRGATPHDEGAPVDEVSDAAAAVTADLPFARHEILHAMRGRVRLRIPVLKTDEALAGVLADYLGMQAGVTNVRVNRSAANLVVSFAPDVVDHQALVALVASFRPDPAAIEAWHATRANPLFDPAQRQSRQKIELALSLAALVAGFVFGPSAALFVVALLWGAIGSVLQRTYRWLFRNRAATLDALVAIAMAALVLMGMLWQAALVPLAWWGVVALRKWMARNTPASEAQEVPIVYRSPAFGAAATAAREAGVKGQPTPVKPATPLRSSILGGLLLWAAGRHVNRMARRTGR